MKDTKTFCPFFSGGAKRSNIMGGAKKHKGGDPAGKRTRSLSRDGENERPTREKKKKTLVLLSSDEEDELEVVLSSQEMDGGDEEVEEEKETRSRRPARKSHKNKKPVVLSEGEDEEDEDEAGEEGDYEDEDEQELEQDEEEDSDEDEDEDDDDYDNAGSSQKSRRAKVSRSKYQEEDSDDDFGFFEPVAKVKRTSKPKAVRQASPDRMTKEQRAEMEDNERGIEKIFQWRWIRDEESASQVDVDHEKRQQLALDQENDGGDKEFFCKYSGLSHIHCEWLPEPVVKAMLRRESATRIRMMQIFLAKDLDPLAKGESPFPEEWKIVARVLDLSDDEDEVLCLWTLLDYDTITWEVVSELTEDPTFEQHLADYKKRIAAEKKGPPKRVPRPDASAAKAYKGLTAEEINLSIEPFPHQIEGISWLLFKWLQHENVILADEMGLGKVRTVMGASDHSFSHVFFITFF